MDMFALRSMAEFESLQPDKWGIPSLQATQIEGRQNGLTHGLDLIVMPGMAFDYGFRRLGHGKGYYDHFLTRYSKMASNMPFLGKKSQKQSLYPRLNSMAVALSLQDQLLSDDIPVVEHDWLIDAIVVGNGEYLDRRVSRKSK